MPELGAFQGEWRVSREIDDARAGTRARFEGLAVLSPGEAGLIYEETGLLHLPGQAAMTATRRYLWRAVEGGIDVHFDDGRFFHRIVAGERPEATHECPPDFYSVTYDFAAWPDWSVRWHVAGPRKEYVLTSSYAPLGACAGRGAGAEGASKI